MSSWIIELHDNPSYQRGYDAHNAGKHLIVPDGEHREAWTLGWNEAWDEGHDIDGEA